MLPNSYNTAKWETRSLRFHLTFWFTFVASKLNRQCNNSKPYVSAMSFNLSRPRPGWREKSNLNYYFHTFFSASKDFMKAFKFPADLVTFTEKLLLGKLHFLYNASENVLIVTFGSLNITCHKFWQILWLNRT